jgi:hypothetical protein
MFARTALRFITLRYELYPVSIRFYVFATKILLNKNTMYNETIRM